MNVNTWLAKEYSLQPLMLRWQRFQFNRKYQQAFLEDFAALIEDGVPANQAIDVIIGVSGGITQKVAEAISLSLAKGQSIADGMQDWFSHTVVEVIRVGESNGALPQTLRAAANSYTQYISALNSFLVSTLYPLSVVVMALGVMVFIKGSVLHSFAEIKPVAQWPGVSQTLYRTATIIEMGWWLILITVVLSGVIINNLLKNVTGETRRWIDDIPIVSLYRESIAARFMETLGLLVCNGVIVRQALSTMQYDASPYLSWHLLQMEYNLSGGQENMGDVLDTNLLNLGDLMRLRVVAMSKGFGEALVSLGAQARQRTAKRIDRLGKILGALLLGTGAMLAMSIIFGIYSVGTLLAA